MEAQKEEMLGKLKELGNGILGKFGCARTVSRASPPLRGGAAALHPKLAPLPPSPASRLPEQLPPRRACSMSLDNFKAEKDPNTGSYNISFQQ